MEKTPERDEENADEGKTKQPAIPKKKRKTEPEVTIAPTQPGGGTDISIG